MSRKGGKYLFLGAILGFIAGLFFAPKKGSELRREAKEKFDEVKENPKDVLHET
ncbi:MAG: YtxH domain-containing protein, partial [Peptostreptococcaceae bacterium]|nr:YtxH domain-containing protein [Peptostreptococcaceae bacterium]